MVIELVILEFIQGIIKRLSLTDEELNSVKKQDLETGTNKEVIKLVNLLKKYINMYFDDYFQIRGFQDIEYRKVLEEIENEIKKDPSMVELQIENLKQFQAFSKAMQKAIVKNLKEPEETTI